MTHCVLHSCSILVCIDNAIVKTFLEIFTKTLGPRKIGYSISSSISADIDTEGVELDDEAMVVISATPLVELPSIGWLSSMTQLFVLSIFCTKVSDMLLLLRLFNDWFGLVTYSSTCWKEALTKGATRHKVLNSKSTANFEKLLDFLSQLLDDGCVEEVISKNFEIIKKFSHKSKDKSYRPYSYNTALYHALQQAYVIR